MLVVRYSGALRCSVCEHRAILERTTADRLVAETGGVLVGYECPEGNGTQVRNPEFERPTAPDED